MTPGASKGLRCFFEPKSIAVAGVSAEPDKLGSIIYSNLLSNRQSGVLRARVYALNPSQKTLFGEPCYPSVMSLPEAPELLIIAVPVSSALGLVRDAAAAGVSGVIMITSGYAEAGRMDLEQEIGTLASEKNMRILGPNTIGILDMRSGVNSLFLRSTKQIPRGGEIISLLPPLKGGVTVITQSGHIGEIISEELASNGIGIRALVGTGNQLDVSVEDVVEYFADDPHTKLIALYLEGVRDGRRFIRAAVRAVKRKPLIVYKVGKTDTGARAARTHTASLVGDYQAYRAAFRQSGIVEAETLQELVDYCTSFSMFPRCAGRRVAIITNAGGVGVIAADEAERSELRTEALGEHLENHLRSRFLGGFISNASLRNPIDLTASVTTEEFAEVVDSVLKARNYDMALVLPTHQTPAMNYDVPVTMSNVVLRSGKPVCMCVMGHSELATKIYHDFMDKGIPTFPTPERAVRALAALPTYESGRRSAHFPPKESREKIRRDQAHQTHKSEWTRKFLQECGVDQPSSKVVHSQFEVSNLEFDFPVACKLLSTKLEHKSDVGGVILDVSGKRGLHAAFSRLQGIARREGLPFNGMMVQQMVNGGVEVILGGTRDPTFGPVVIVGVGGIFTELSRDFALSIAPVNPTDAKEMIGRTKLGAALQGYRGKRADVDSLSGVISKFSAVLFDYPSIEEIEVNPLMLTANKILAVDSRVVFASR
jgi:acetate---CoA ligase (ADP-forming)